MAASLADCSRFWECGPAGETCLFECAACQTEMNSNPLCDGQWALTFDVRFQYPVGPVCDWPSTINCTLGKLSNQKEMKISIHSLENFFFFFAFLDEWIGSDQFYVEWKMTLFFTNPFERKFPFFFFLL